MLKRVAVIILLLLSLFSCAKEGFDVNTAKLSHETVYEDGIKVEEKIKFSTILSKTGKYELTLIDSNNEITFNSPLKLEGEYYVSDELKITKYSTFQRGDYKYKIIRDDGTEYSGSVKLDFEDTKPLTLQDSVDYLEAYIGDSMIATTDGSDYPPLADKIVLVKEDSFKQKTVSIILLGSTNHLP